MERQRINISEDIIIVGTIYNVPKQVYIICRGIETENNVVVFVADTYLKK